MPIESILNYGLYDTSLLVHHVQKDNKNWGAPVGNTIDMNRIQVTVRAGLVEYSWQNGSRATPRTTPRVSFDHPFNNETIGEVRWYLEEYLKFPYGSQIERAERVKENMKEWGSKLYNSVFAGSDNARAFFQEAKREGLDNCELSISGDDPGVLKIPWELLHIPHHVFLAPSLGGI